MVMFRYAHGAFMLTGRGVFYLFVILIFLSPSDRRR